MRREFFTVLKSIISRSILGTQKYYTRPNVYTFYLQLIFIFDPTILFICLIDTVKPTKKFKNLFVKKYLLFTKKTVIQNFITLLLSIHIILVHIYEQHFLKV